MAWGMEYVAATLTLALLVIFLFKMNWSGGLCPPVAATVIGVMINFKLLHDFILHHHRRYKTYRIAYPTFSYVLTTDPANVEHILRSNFANYIKGKPHHDVMEDLLGDGIFSVDGEPWRQQRKLASFEFSTKVLRDFSSVVFQENAVKLSKILLENFRTKQTVEMQAC
jgi:cytochrome P450